MRIACVYAPQIALQAVLRRDPELRQDAVVLAEATAATAPGAVAERARVVALTRAAHRAGVRPGMTVSQARAVGAALGQSLRVIAASAADLAAAQAALTDVGHAFAPRVEAEAGRVFLDVGDLGRLYPHERSVAQGIAAQAARLGLAVRVAVASSKPVARIASDAEDIAIVAPGEERAFLAPLPLRHALGAPDLAGDAAELRATLERWGIRTLGALAALPLGEVSLRLGEAGTRLRRAASATLEEPFLPSLPPDALEEGTELDYAVHELEPLAFVLRGLLDRAMTRLTCRGLGCVGITLRLKLDPRGFEVREVPLGAPTRETATLLQLVRLELARRPPSAPVVGLALLMLPARVRAVQLDLLRPAGPAPERLAATIARLAALVGLENVGTPGEVDSYREEAIAVRAFAGMGAGGMQVPAVRGRNKKNGGTSNRSSGSVPPFLPVNPSEPAAENEPALAFRRFRPPQALEVLMGRDGPVALRGKETTARILVAAGPYRATAEWWSGDGWSRDYWDVQASDGAVYRLHQDRRDGGWYLDGYYD